MGKLRNMTSIYLRRGGKLLLLYRQGSAVVNDLWIGSAGGHFEAWELNDARACVLRELKEELGIGEEMLENLALRYVTLRLVKGEIRQNYYFFADLKENLPFSPVSNEGISRWFTPEELHGLEMPFTAKYVVEHYLSTGQFTHCLYGGVADGTQVVFTQM